MVAIDSTARICRTILHSSSSRTSNSCCVSSLRTHSRTLSQRSDNGSTPSYSKRPRPPHARDSRPTAVDSADAIAHLRNTFPPLKFPADVAQRMTTHISWNRGIDGHNGRLAFVGRRVLHTYLLLFLHECSLLPRGYTHRKNAPVPPSSRLRHSELAAGGPIDEPLEAYDGVSERLLNTYVLGEHVGAAWELERIMRWTPAVAELDPLRTASPDSVLRSSGLYKVRGATVEGVVGGIFHQFGGSIAHRVFHTRVLPYISHLGLPPALRTRVDEVCERFGGQNGLLVDQSSGRERTKKNLSERRDQPESENRPPELGRLQDSKLKKRTDVEFTKVNAKQSSVERQRLGYAS